MLAPSHSGTRGTAGNTGTLSLGQILESCRLTQTPTPFEQYIKHVYQTNTSNQIEIANMP